MATKLMTPGVYIEEKDAFPGSVVAVETAIPAFIGYTEKASRSGKSLKNKPTRVTSLQEYAELFGGDFKSKFTITAADPDDEMGTKINNENKVISYKDKNVALMSPSIKLFYANGGSVCYIVSVGTYENSDELELEGSALLGTKKDANGKIIEGGLVTLKKVQEPTMVLVPDAVNLASADDCYSVYVAVLKHCSEMQSRMGLLDIYKGYESRINDPDPAVDIVTNFREKIGSENLNYAAAYYPWLHTNIKPLKEVTFKDLSLTMDELAQLLPEDQAKKMIGAYSVDTATVLKKLSKEKPKDVEEAKRLDLKPDEIADIPDPGPFETAEPQDPGDGTEDWKDDHATWEKARDEHKKLTDEFTANEAIIDRNKTTDLDTRDKVLQANKEAIKAFEDNLITNLDSNKLPNLKSLVNSFIDTIDKNLHQGLDNFSPTYKVIMAEVCAVMNLLPPAAAMAGIYTMVDTNRGVWKAPANVSVSNVIKPAANITHADQENLNVDAVSGKSINAIRTFPGVGTMVWGGRTLDGNSLDWRYVSVRRTIIMLEQSIKLALRSYVFEPNDANTWVTVKSMIVNFLTDYWKQGALAGSSPDDAFEVQIGLGSTMTALDILEGKMLVSVKLAIVRPAEFIVVTFQQQMQKS